MIAPNIEQTSPKREMVAGLDSLRWFAALWVALSHLAANLPVDPASALGARLWTAVELGTSGRVAVALFFVISGFCIHLRQAETLTLDARDFLLRRGLRIGLPLLAVVVLSHGLGGWAVAAVSAVLWSVYCEIIYYAFYPLLLSLRQRFSMGRILASSCAVSTALIAGDTMFEMGVFRGVPSLAYCIPMFPLWLLGAWLAERHRTSVRAVSLVEISCWRAGAVLLCVAANLIRLVGVYPASWLLYGAVGVFCFFYLPKELSRWGGDTPPALTERLGRSSYSLYLVHIVPISLMIQLSSSWPFWALALGQGTAIALATFCFYTLCEAPAHRLARSIPRRRPQATSAVVSTAA